MAIERKDEEIDRVLYKASRGEAKGSAYPGMSYEQGIMDMYNWLTGNIEDEPLADVVEE